MAGEDLSDAARHTALGDMLGLMMHQAVAEGAIAMTQGLKDGTPEHDRWTEVARKAVPLYGEFLEGVKERHPEIAADIGGGQISQAEMTTEPTLNPIERTKKQKRLAKIEAEAARLREELSE